MYHNPANEIRFHSTVVLFTGWQVWTTGRRSLDEAATDVQDTHPVCWTRPRLSSSGPTPLASLPEWSVHRMKRHWTVALVFSVNLVILNECGSFSSAVLKHRTSASQRADVSRTRTGRSPGAQHRKWFQPDVVQTRLVPTIPQWVFVQVAAPFHFMKQ